MLCENAKTTAIFSRKNCIPMKSLSPPAALPDMPVESHPLEPFLPAGAHTLFLGSFPPPRARWSMEFFYPNWTNDFWRIMGFVHYGDARHFERHEPGVKAFCQERIVRFCQDAGLAFFDTARRVRRLKGNASDNFLEIVEPTDVGSLMAGMPLCRRIVTTGGKASDELQQSLEAAVGGKVEQPAIGSCTRLEAFGREVEWWRMPSSSRAYPMKLEKKAEHYARLFR